MADKKLEMSVDDKIGVQSAVSGSTKTLDVMLAWTTGGTPPPHLIRLAARKLVDALDELPDGDV